MSASEFNECVLCDQAFGASDRDAPSDSEFSVSCAKDGGQECMTCWNCRRGSFKPKAGERPVSLEDFKRKMTDFKKLSTEFKELRKDYLVAKLKGSKRHKHRPADLLLLTQKEEEEYIDVYETHTWTELTAFVNLKKPGNKLRTPAQRTAYVQKLGLEVVLDDQGVEGVCTLKGDGSTKEMKKGKRISTKKIKQLSHEDVASFQAAHDKGRESVQLKGVGLTEQEVEQRIKEMDGGSSSDSSGFCDSDSDSFGFQQKKHGASASTAAAKKRRIVTKRREEVPLASSDKGTPQKDHSRRAGAEPPNGKHSPAKDKEETASQEGARKVVDASQAVAFAWFVCSLCLFVFYLFLLVFVCFFATWWPCVGRPQKRSSRLRSFPESACGRAKSVTETLPPRSPRRSAWWRASRLRLTMQISTRSQI
jgi:hypothetical protein